MSPARQPDTELDGLIEEITVDCHDESVVGEHVDVLSVAGEDERHELIATCERNARRYEIALLDIELTADPDTSRLIAAYRRWIRA